MSRRNQWSSENEDVAERRLNAAARQWAEDLAEIADALEWACGNVARAPVSDAPAGRSQSSALFLAESGPRGYAEVGIYGCSVGSIGFHASFLRMPRDAQFISA